MRCALICHLQIYKCPNTTRTDWCTKPPAPEVVNPPVTTRLPAYLTLRGERADGHIHTHTRAHIRTHTLTHTHTRTHIRTYIRTHTHPAWKARLNEIFGFNLLHVIVLKLNSHTSLSDCRRCGHWLALHYNVHIYNSTFLATHTPFAGLHTVSPCNIYLDSSAAGFDATVQQHRVLVRVINGHSTRAAWWRNSSRQLQRARMWVRQFTWNTLSKQSESAYLTVLIKCTCACINTHRENVCPLLFFQVKPEHVVHTVALPVRPPKYIYAAALAAIRLQHRCVQCSRRRTKVFGG